MRSLENGIWPLGLLPLPGVRVAVAAQFNGEGVKISATGMLTRGRLYGLLERPTDAIPIATGARLATHLQLELRTLRDRVFQLSEPANQWCDGERLI